MGKYQRRRMIGYIVNKYLTIIPAVEEGRRSNTWHFTTWFTDKCLMVKKPTNFFFRLNWSSLTDFSYSPPRIFTWWLYDFHFRSWLNVFLLLTSAICVKYLELAGGTWSLTSGHVVGYPAPRAQGQANDKQLQEGQQNHKNCISKMSLLCISCQIVFFWYFAWQFFEIYLHLVTWSF